MKYLVLFAIFFLGLLDLSLQEKANAPEKNPFERISKIFNVVKFPNDLCESSPLNGTCYTKTECADRGGTASGNCANGYGVCCVISLECGGTSRDNCTYMQLGPRSTFTSSNEVCTYKVCQTNDKVCRIRLDFQTFSITGPVTGQTIAAVTDVKQRASAIGDCTKDSFRVASQGLSGSPVICGINTGQHMVLDTVDCIDITFAFDTADTTTSRSISIKAIQYICGDDNGGPPGCLQYFQENTGTVASFNFPTTSSTITSTATHLSSQKYTMCFRRNEGKCAICFIPSITISTDAGNTVSTQSSFGLSVSPSATIAYAGFETSCTADYLVISSAGTEATQTTVDTDPREGNTKFCGRYFGNGNNAGATSVVSKCTSRRPFTITFITDNDELEGTSPADAASQTAFNNEQELAPGGIVGFSLDFRQATCT